MFLDSRTDGNLSTDAENLSVTLDNSYFCPDRGRVGATICKPGQDMPILIPIETVVNCTDWIPHANFRTRYQHISSGTAVAMTVT